MHVQTADLNLQSLAIFKINGCVQGLVKIILRRGYVIVEFAWHGPPHLMHNPQHLITGSRILYDDAYRPHVKDLIKRNLPPLHFPPDAVNVFRVARNFGGNAIVTELRLKFFDHFLDVEVPIRTPLVDQRGNFLVAVRIQVAEAQIFQFPFDLPDTEPVRERRENFQRFTRHTLFAFVAQVAQRPHVVETISKLDQDDTHVVIHRQQRLTKVFGLAVTGLALADTLGIERYVLHLGDASYQTGDFFAKTLLDFFR